jgi:hypothetical protein
LTRLAFGIVVPGRRSSLRKVSHAQRTAKIRARYSHADWTEPHWRRCCRDEADIARVS